MDGLRTVVIDAHTAGQEQPVWKALEALGPVTVYPRSIPAEVIARCRDAEVVLTNKVVLDAGVVGALPHLRYVGITATGVNVVDVQACTDRGVVVTNVPAYSSASVAQLVVSFVLHFAQRVAQQSAGVKAGDWARAPDFCWHSVRMMELAGKRAAIVGHGGAGRVVAAGLRGLGMEAVAAQVPGRPARSDRVPLREALESSQVVTLHCPLSPSTERMVNAEFLGAMREGAWLINTARGGLVDEGALLDALRQGRLGGVALDVLTQEPPAREHPLLDPTAAFADRVVVTPHIAWATEESRLRLVAEAIENTMAWARGKRRNRVT